MFKELFNYKEKLESLFNYEDSNNKILYIDSNYIDDLIYDIDRWWIDITQPFRNIKYGIQNIWAWFPVIWNDRNWEDYFLLKIIEFKLKQMKKHLDIYRSDTRKDRDLLKLDVTLGRLDRYLNSDKYYKSPYPEIHHKHYMKDGVLYTERFTEEESKIIHDKYQDEFKWSKKQYNKFWDCLKKYAEYWWD